MPAYNSIQAALAAIQKKVMDSVNDTLLNEVSHVVKVAEVHRIMEDVYSRETGGQYERRYFDGGLGDPANLKERLEGDGVLAISNDTPFNPYLNGLDESNGLSENSGRFGLAGLVNFGDGWNGIEYDWAKSGETNFIENTRIELSSEKTHVNAMKDGLKKRGFNVK